MSIAKKVTGGQAPVLHKILLSSAGFYIDFTKRLISGNNLLL